MLLNALRVNKKNETEGEKLVKFTFCFLFFALGLLNGSFLRAF